MRRFHLTWLLALCALLPLAAYTDDRQTERERMVEELRRYGSGETAVTDERVLAAMRRVPRHEFVPRGERRRAYQDRPLDIGHGQTISQPYIVALMSQLADVEPGMRVLEVGTGSGYHAAVLGELTEEVYTIEIIAPLAEAVPPLYERLGYDHIETTEGDGYYGWEEHAPFDRIVVTAAAEHIPPPLIEQLEPGGRMIIPVGPRWGAQRLMLVLKDENESVTTRSLMPVRFVPLTGDR